jgi:hypothetical protein
VLFRWQQGPLQTQIFALARGEKERGGNILEFPHLDRYLAEAGFEDFRPCAYVSILVFSARKILMEQSS